jgi:hypothetical protein
LGWFIFHCVKNKNSTIYKGPSFHKWDTKLLFSSLSNWINCDHRRWLKKKRSQIHILLNFTCVLFHTSI